MSGDALSKVELEYLKANIATKTVVEIAEKLQKDVSVVQRAADAITAEDEKRASRIFKRASGAKKSDAGVFEEVTVYRFKYFDYIIAGVLALFALILYVYLHVPSLSAGDHGELTSATYFMGIGHAPGYPLFTLLAKIFTYLPFNNVAWRVSFFAMTMSAVAVFLVYLFIVKLLAYNRTVDGFVPRIHVPAILATFLYAVSDTLLTSRVAEVYTLNIALIAAMLLIYVMWAQDVWKYRSLPKPYYGTKYLLAFAFIYGVSLGAHSTVLPFGIGTLVFVFGLLFAAHLWRKVAMPEIALVSVGIFVVVLFVAFAGYLKFFMSLNSNLLFNQIGGFQQVSLSEYIRIAELFAQQGTSSWPQAVSALQSMGVTQTLSRIQVTPDPISLSSFWDIITAPFRVPGLFSDMLKLMSERGLIQNIDLRIQTLKNPMYPNLYFGIFSIFWPLLVAFVWYIVYKGLIAKNSSRLKATPDVISDITINYYEMLALFVIGFVVFVYMPIRARQMPPLNWGQMNEPGNTWENLSYFFNMFHRKQYGKLGADIPAPYFFHPHQITLILKIYLKQFAIGFGIFLLIIPGIVQMFKRIRYFAIFAVSAFVVYVFPLTYYINPPGGFRSAFFFEVFLLPATLYLIMFIAFGIQFYCEYFDKKLAIRKFLSIKDEDLYDPEVQKKPLLKRFAPTDYAWLGVVAACGIVAVSVNANNNNNHNNWLDHDYCYNIMNSLEPNAIVATEGGDNQVFGLAYFTMVEHRRPDIKVYDQKGNVFERIYGNLMKVDYRWLDDIRDAVDKTFIESGRPYYTLWQRAGLEQIGDYYFKPYGVVFKVQPLRYFLIDTLLVYDTLTVREYRERVNALRRSMFDTTYTQSRQNPLYLSKLEARKDEIYRYSSAQIRRDIHALLDEGLIDAPRKAQYDGSERIRFKKMYKTPFANIQSEEELWALYERESHSVVAREAKHYDPLSREILTSYELQKLDLNRRLASAYETKRALHPGRRAEYTALIEQLDEERLQIFERIEYFAERLGHTYYNLAGHYLSLAQTATNAEDRARFTEKARELYEKTPKAEPDIYHAYLNLAQLDETAARAAEDDTTMSNHLLDARKRYEQAAKRIIRNNGGKKSNYSNSQVYRQTQFSLERVDLQLAIPNSAVRSMEAQAKAVGAVSSYIALANTYWQRYEFEESESTWRYIVGRKDATREERKQALLRLGELYLALQRFDEAAAMYSKAISERLVEGAERNRLEKDIAGAYLNAQEWNKAASAIRTLLAGSGLSAAERDQYEFQLGIVHLNRGAFRDALSFFEKHTNETGPGGAVMSFYAGHAYRELQRTDDALAAYDRAIREGYQYVSGNQQLYQMLQEASYWLQTYGATQ